jgi:histone deacetylase complex subunit SAP30
VSRESDSGSDSESPEVDFYSLQVQTLRRYKKFYKVSTRPGLNKAQLADIISKHFMTIPVKEKEVLAYFIYSVKHTSGVQNNVKGLD